MGYFDLTLTSWVLSDVPKIIFEVIRVMLRITGPKLGSVIVKKTGSDSQFWDTLAPSDTPARYFSNCILPGPGYLAEIILSALTKPL